MLLLGIGTAAPIVGSRASYCIITTTAAGITTKIQQSPDCLLPTGNDGIIEVAVQTFHGTHPLPVSQTC
jgi:hypothetical protein